MKISDIEVALIDHMGSAQYESRIVAEKVVEKVRELFPVSINALLENK